MSARTLAQSLGIICARPLVAALVTLTMTLGATSAYGQKVDIKRRGSFTAAELALLPAFCRDIYGTPGYKGAQGDHWRSLMGNDFQHMHHYCRGLRDRWFALNPTVDRKTRMFLWNRASKEFAYVIKASRPKMVLMPEVHYRQGEAFVRLGRWAEAEAALRRSRELKPDYWLAYTMWADRLIDLKLFGDARQLLEEGLRHSPDSDEIRQRLAQLPAASR